MSDIIVSFSVDQNACNNINCEGARPTKKREFKGTSANRHIDDYCIVDLETTGVFVNSADIIEISSVKVRNNQVVEEYSTLVNPLCHIPAAATAVNHITDEMVKNAPVLDDVIDSFLSFVGDDVIVGYNNATFDMNLIYDKVQELKNIHFGNDYIDLLHASRRCLEGLENYKLETVSNYYGLDTEGEHRALKDCYLTKDCYDKLFEEYGDTAFKRRSHSSHYSSKGKSTAYSSETLLLRELHTLIEGILEDGKVTIDEIDTLRFWIEENRDLSGHYPFDKAFNALDDVLEDGIITSEELEDLKKIFSELIDPVKCNSCHDNISSLLEKHVCLTGEFNCGTKRTVENMIINAGGIIDKSVKKSTDYLIVGAYGSEAWKTGNYGGKIQKAMEFNAKGTDIKIMEEVDFVPMLTCLISNSEGNIENE